MKKILSAVLVAVMLTATLVTVNADTVKYGDVNADGKINNRDLAQLQQYLADWDVEVDETIADVTGDGKVNNRDLALLQQYLADWDVELGPEEPEEPEVPPVELPAVGYDLDGRGRIFIKAISQEGNLVTITLENISNMWMTEETSNVDYTCTDADGNVLTFEENRYYGTLYFGMLEAKEVDTFTIVLPEGTVKLELGECYTRYWSQWA